MGVCDGCGEFYEAEVGAAEAVDGLDGYVLEGIGGVVEFVVRDSSLEREVRLEGLDPVLVKVSLSFFWRQMKSISS